MKSNKDTKSRFRILKGGKISLVVCALIIGSIVNEVEAATTVTSGTSRVDVVLVANDTVTVDGNLNVVSADSGLVVDVDTFGLDLDITATSEITVNRQGLAHTLSIIGGGSNVTDLSIINNNILSATTNNNLTSATSRTIKLDNIIDSSITNNKTITASATSATDDANAYGIYAIDIENSDIINSGTITANASGGTAFSSAHGIYVSNFFHTGSTIQNSGNITSTLYGIADKKAYSINLNNSSAGSTITNTSTGVLNGNINIDGNATMSNAGTISLPYNANEAASSTHDAFIANFTNTATGTLEIGLNTAADGITINKYSKLNTTNATFDDGSTIKVNVLTASGNQSLLEGETLTDVVSAYTSVTIAGVLNITDNSALLDFEYIQNAKSIDLNIIKGQSLTNSVVLGGGNSSTQSAATILGSGNSAFNGVVSQLNTLGTNKAVAQAVATTTAQTVPANLKASSEIMRGMQNIVEMRQNSEFGPNLEDSLLSNKNVWFKPYFSTGKQNDKNGINGFDVKARGFGMGMDTEYDTNKKIGLALFYTQADVDINNVSQSSDLDIFTALVYGNVPVLDDETRFLYQIGYSGQKTSSTRNIFNGDTAKADYTSTTASVDLKLMRDYQVNGNLLLQPVIGATYRRSSSPEYTESGAGSLNLETSSSSTTELIGEIGTQAKYKINENSKILASLHVGYNFKDDQSTVTSSFQGSSGTTFDTKGIDNSRVNYKAGLGYEMKDVLGGEINFMYNYQANGSDFSNNTFSAKYVLKF